MRKLRHFSLPEWLRFLPLRHALKQWRNDAWLAFYQRRRATELPEFLARTKGCAGGHVLLVVAFEQPWALDWLLRMAKRHVQDAVVLVFDNSRPAARQAIADVCLRNATAYLPLPSNRTRHVNRSHGMAMSWVHHNVVPAIGPRSFAFIDHDLIPIAPVQVASLLGAQPFYGLEVTSAWAWQLWAGYCLFNQEAVRDLRMNFLYDFSQGLDTGGRNWRGLYRRHERSRLRFADSRAVDLRIPANGRLIEVQVIDGRWLHIGGISYNDTFQSKAQWCEQLAQALDEGMPWQQLRVPEAEASSAVAKDGA